ncbi:androgen-induced gene 1 protein isoform X6 [Petromyzon marinus]|uniref:androgen-induced gene 1 protein isoform X6 n=1 Tax=Petromyzon marinus TaxID=7757 RepID=UPI003F722E0B
MLCTARAMALIPAPLLRVSILLAYFSVLCAYRAVDIPAQQTYGGSWKFLTYINVVIQTCFFAVAVLGDASKFLHQGGSGLAMDQQLTKLTRLRDRIFTVLAFPIGTFVVIAFWAMYSWDREMVHPEVLDSFIPAWLHHGMHRAALPALGDPHDATSLPKQSHGPPRHRSLQRRLHRLGEKR